MKYWTIRIPDPIPLGLILLLAIARAIVSASLVNKSFGGKVETVFTLCDQRLTRFSPENHSCGGELDGDFVAEFVQTADEALRELIFVRRCIEVGA